MSSLLLILLLGLASPQDGRPQPGERRLHAMKISERINMDGRFEEPVWALAPLATGFTQNEPREGQPAAENTEVRVLYDSQNIYFGLYAHDSPGARLVVNDLKKDFATDGGDTFEVVLDTFHDRRNGYIFSTNPAGAKADAVDRASRRLVFEVVLSEDQGNFRFGRTELPDAAKARLDEMITELKSDPKGAYFEIEGHTDDVGPTAVNEKIGLGRAEAVKRYLYEQHQIPLHKINVISYGEDKPVAPNRTRDDRAQNRRVVVRVLA